MINLLKLLRFWDKPKPEQSDLRPSERHAYEQKIKQLKEQHYEAIEWWKHNNRYLRLSLFAKSSNLDEQIIEFAKLKSQIAKKATPKKRKKK